jgi:hypothetical protein
MKTLIPIALILLACSSKKQEDATLKEAFEIHEMAMQIGEHVTQKVERIESYADQSTRELQASLLDSALVLRKDLAVWESSIIEVPGMEHEHHHDHHHQEVKLTPEMVLEVQKYMRDEIIRINIRAQKLWDTLKTIEQNEIIEAR